MRKPYDHQAVPWTTEDGVRECRICPTPITGWGDQLRHIDEAFRPAPINPAHTPDIAKYVEWGTEALENMLTDRVSDHDRAQRVVEELYLRGAFTAPPKRTQQRRRARAA